MKKIELNIDGIKCEGCINRIKNILSTIKGIFSYDISLKDKKLILSVKKENTIDEAIDKIESLGFVITR